MDHDEWPRAQPGEIEEGADVGGGEAARPSGVVSLTLFVAGATRRSQEAVSHVKRLCEEQLPDAYELAVIDVYQDPEAARDARVIVAPTLIRNRPEPVRRLSGDLSDCEFVMARLELRRGPH